MLLKNKKIGLFAVSAAIFFGSAGFVNNYFEISKNLEIFTAMYREVNSLYVEEIEPNRFVRSGLDAMLASLDPYTNFISEQEVEDFRFQTTGSYGGIGALVNVRHDTLVIFEPYEGGPAIKAGLRAGDQILEIDGKSVIGDIANDFGKMLKGQASTEVALKILRFGETTPTQVKVAREEIQIKSVSYTGMINPQTGFIKLSGFRPMAGKEMVDAFTEVKNKGAKQLILDLRDNPGGSLDEAIRIAAIFLPKFSLVVDTRGKNKEWDKKYNTAHDPIDTAMPIVVLVNENSASASEIIAGVLQDYDRAVVVGQKSFGKGLVQTVRPLPYNNQIKVTTARFYTPSGRCIQAIDYASKNEVKKADSLQQIFYTKNNRPVFDAGGIKPDIFIEPNEYSILTQTLLEKGLIFEFANFYKSKNDTLISGVGFKFENKHFEEFKTYLKNKSYTYETNTEKLLEVMEKEAKNEKYLATIDADLKILRNKIIAEKEQDVNKYKAEIAVILENEIIARYFYQTGRLENSFKHVPDIKKALALLINQEEYKNLLKAK